MFNYEALGRYILFTNLQRKTMRVVCSLYEGFRALRKFQMKYKIKTCNSTICSYNERHLQMSCKKFAIRKTGRNEIGHTVFHVIFHPKFIFFSSKIEMAQGLIALIKA